MSVHRASVTTRLLLGLLDRSIRLLHAFTTDELLMPFISLRILLRELFVVEISTQSSTSRDGIPWNKHQIGEGDFVAYKVWLASFREMRIDDAEDAADLVGVAVDG